MFSCKKNIDQELLHGKWKVAEFYSEGNPIRSTALKEISFDFKPNNRYFYKSTLNRKEAGRYQITGNSLSTTDTLSPNGKEKVVEMIKLTADSLTLKMMNDKKEQKLILYKVK